MFIQLLVIELGSGMESMILVIAAAVAGSETATLASAVADSTCARRSGDVMRGTSDTGVDARRSGDEEFH